MEIECINGLTLSEEGIWRLDVNESISYTKDGHDLIVSSEDSSFWYQHRLEVLEKLIIKFGIEELLDVGGGNGQISKYLQDKGINTILLEPIEKGTLNAKKNGVKKVIHASFGELELPSNTVQSIGLFDVLEHIENDATFLKKAYKTIKPDGLLFITVPALQMLYSDFDREVGHYRRYSLKHLEKKVKDVGLDANL